MKNRLFLGLDVGTTNVTALVMDATGLVVDVKSRALGLKHPAPGHVEQDPSEVLDAVEDTAGQLVQVHDVEGVGLDNQGESFLLWSASLGQTLTPSIVWQDQRAADWCRATRDSVDVHAMRQRTGLLLDSYFSGPKLRVLLDQEPRLQGLRAQGDLRFGTLDSWIIHQLSSGGDHITDASTASRTLMFDLHTLQWSPMEMALFGATPAMLPKVVDSAGQLATLNLGGKQVPLLAMLTDQQAALWGQCCFQPGEAKCTLGTGAFVLMNTGAVPKISSHGLLTTVAWKLGDEVDYALDGGVLTAGAAIQWLKELGLLGAGENVDDVADRAQHAELTVIPSLHGLGAPRWMTSAHGAVLGIGRDCTREDVVAATLWGIAAQIADVVEAMEKDAGRAFSSLRVDGGPTQSRYLMQVLADLTQREVLVSVEREATAKGSAMLAAFARGCGSREQWAARWRKGASFVPTGSPALRRQQWERGVERLRRWHNLP